MRELEVSIEERLKYPDWFWRTCDDCRLNTEDKCLSKEPCYDQSYFEPKLNKEEWKTEYNRRVFEGRIYEIF